MSAQACSFPGCGRPLFCRGICSGHYWQMGQGRELTPIVNRREMTADERFATFVSPEPNTGCHLWTGAVSGHGCGVFRVDGGYMPASRYALVRATGGDRPGLDACHTCDTPACVNEGHLFWGTRKENLQDSIRKGRFQFTPNVRAHREGRKAPQPVRTAEWRRKIGDTHRGRPSPHRGKPWTPARRAAFERSRGLA